MTAGSSRAVGAGVSPWRLALSLLETALWFALVTGAFHLTWLLCRAFLLGQVISAGLHLVWIVPGSYALLLGGVSLIPALLLLAWPRAAVWIAAVFALAALSLFSALLLVKQMHPLAAVVLALGAGTRWAHSWRLPQQRRFIRRWNVALVLLVAFGALGASLGPRLHEAGVERSLPPAAPDAPNVLLIVLDTVRARNLGVYGYQRPTTPHLDRWAREGTVFEYAIAPAPWTLPTHAALFTGLPPAQLSARFTRRLHGDQPRLAEVLQARGYVTAGFSGNNAYGTAEAGLARGFQHYVSHRSSPDDLMRIAKPFQTELWKSLVGSRTPGDVLRAFWHFDLTTPFIVHGERYLTAPELRVQARHWIEQHSRRPFFVFLNLFDAHTQDGRPTFPITRFHDGPSSTDRYDSAIALMDKEVATLLDELRANGTLDRTIVVLTADHGEHFGEHGLLEHGNSLYLPLLHVPLVVRYPSRVAAAVRVAEPVSLVDLPATILDLAEAGPRLPGRNLLEASNPPRAHEPVLADVERAVAMTVRGPTRRGAMRSLLDQNWHYIRNGDGLEELYVYRTDAAETSNLAGNPAHADALGAMRETLARIPPGYEP